MPTSTNLFGRDPDIDFIVEHLIRAPESPASKRARFALLGTGGMGKTSLALKVMRDGRLVSCYPEYNQAWFPCVQATSFSLLLDTIHSALDITGDTKNTVNDIINDLRSSTPIILLFDNFETPWNAAGARAEVAQLLRDLDAIPHVVLFITMRATIEPCEEIDWTTMRIEPLNPDASCRLYTEIDTKASHDEKLPGLLEMLGHMPLAVKLMARQGKSTDCTVEELTESYLKIGTAMLGPSEGSDPQNSVSISISMSLNSPQIIREPGAIILLSRISMLPRGTTFSTLERWWAADIPNLQNALQALLEASLLERRTSIYSVLPVIRAHVLDPFRFPSQLPVMIEAACRFLQRYASLTPGEPSYNKDIAARSVEEINLQSILLAITSSETKFIEAFYILAWHQYRTRPRTEVIQHAVKLAKAATNQKLFGELLYCYGATLFCLNNLEESLEQFKCSRQIYIAISEPRLAALALLDIADVSPYIYPEAEEIPLLEQARLELETIQSPRPKITHRFSSLQIRFKKSKPKDSSSMDDQDMEKCLRDLAKAYSRRGHHSKAIEHLIHAREFCSNSPFRAARCAQALALTYHRVRQYDEAEKWGLLGLEAWKELGNSAVAFVLRILGRIYISKGQYDQAIDRLKEGLNTANSRENRLDAAYILLELGRAQMKKGAIDDSQASFTEALDYFGSLEAAVQDLVVCRFYLDRLKDPLQAPTNEERNALHMTWHHEDIPP
ncbi:hypothetical protein C8J56DRAFT_176957 [Mycena floridula]|nr:hypothetical protein C8J56DRAFT_176957 [Mycena floridula]